MKIDKYETIEGALKREGDNIYVINTSDKNNTQTKGKVAFALPGENGARTVVFLQPSWIPVNLMTYGMRESITASLELRDLMRAGYVTMITSESAEALMKLPSYPAEKARVDALTSKLVTPSENGTTSMTLNIGTGPTVASDTTGSEVRVNSAALTALIAANVETYGAPNIELAEKVDTYFPTLTADDFAYLIANVKDHSSTLYQLSMDAHDEITGGNAVVPSTLPTYNTLRG